MYKCIATSLTLMIFGFTNTVALAADAAPPVSEKVNVDTIKEKYWAQGNEAELGVIQNRTYSKVHRVEFGLFGGLTSSDPFLSVKDVGASLGFHFSEFFAVHLLGWKSYAGNSSARTKFEEFTDYYAGTGESGATVNVNRPKWYLGSEASGSLIYGKLSLMGKAILYYDMHVLGGAGLTSTESGNYLTPHLGIGQQIYMTKRLSFRLDYRLSAYQEKILETEVTSQIGDVRGERTNWSHVVTFGLSVLLGGM